MTHSGSVLARREDLEVIDCEACGFAHLNPIPEVDADYYRAEFWQKTKPGSREVILKEANWWRMTYRDWLSLIPAPGNRIVDVGCGYGMFIETARVEGWDCVGVEPSDEARMNGLSQCPIVSSDNPIREMNDVLSMQWLLEHLPNPEVELKRWAERLVPSGVLFLVVPQELTSWQRRASAKSAAGNYWIHPTHINYFAANSITNLVERCGFKVWETLATYPMERWLLECDVDYPATPVAGGVCHKVVRDDEMSQARVTRLSRGRMRASIGVGRDLILIARKA